MGLMRVRRALVATGRCRGDGSKRPPARPMRRRFAVGSLCVLCVGIYVVKIGLPILSWDDAMASGVPATPTILVGGMKRTVRLDADDLPRLQAASDRTGVTARRSRHSNPHAYAKNTSRDCESNID